MTAKTAKFGAPRKRVVFLVYQGINLLDLSGPLQVFSHAADFQTGANGYDCLVVSVDGAQTETNTVLSIPTTPMAQVLDGQIHTLIIVGGSGAVAACRNKEVVEGARLLAHRATRVCSVCSGALVLAATGWLNGRRAVTHWDDCKMLAEDFPHVQVELDPIFVKDGPVWTSAGITAGIDMALAIVAEDLGRKAALHSARSMVAQMVRSGGQSQFSPVLSRQLQDGAGQFDGLHDWMSDNLRGTLTVETLAERANMSARNFARVYTRTMGLTPAKAVEAMRVERAQDLLGGTDHSLKKVADTCGFGDEDRMRRAFWRVIKVSPAEYRQNFRAGV